MPEPRSKRIVVDASVAAAAGNIDPSEQARRCREALDAIRVFCHRVVMTDTLWQEWMDHQSNWARGWLVTMRRHTKVIEIPDHAGAMRAAVSAHARSGADRDAMLKDMHLVEAASSTDRLILSLDERSRRLFRDCAGEVSGLSGLVWVNPADASERARAWLLGGARPDASRRLASGQEVGGTHGQAP